MLAEAAAKLLGGLEAFGITPDIVAESARCTSAPADRVLAARRDVTRRAGEVATLAGAFAALSQSALPPEESADLIRRVAKEAQA